MKTPSKIPLSILVAGLVAWFGFVIAIYVSGRPPLPQEITVGLAQIETAGTNKGAVRFHTAENAYSTYYPLAMYVQSYEATNGTEERPMWGFVRVAKIEHVDYLTQKRGLQLVVPGNFADQNYVGKEMLPFYAGKKAGADVFWDPVKRQNTSQVPSQFFIVVWLDKRS